MKKHQWIAGLVVLAALIGLVLWGRHHVNFEFGKFWHQLTHADWTRIAIALACIYMGYVFRSARWAFLLRHNQKVPPFSLIGTQVIGFTGVALIGRVADLVRPYLVSRRTGLPLSSQIAVYIVERLFDMGSIAIVFSIALLQLPQDEVLKATNQMISRSSLLSHAPVWLAPLLAQYGGLLLTLAGALFLVAVRVSGEAMAAASERVFGLISHRAGNAVAAKIRAFHTGLDTIRSFSELGVTVCLSLAMWGLITYAYLEILRAFVASPELANISFGASVLLMVISGSASIIQLPVIGWFTQIGFVAFAIQLIVHPGAEPATACAATLLLITFLSIVPVGLVWARFEHVSLRKIAEESGHSEEELDGRAVPDSL
ncbi:MAG TPA: lysylphosphatidylglycerol synthase transmembrane domain-containing protein [Terracidiphilus sp.]